MFPLIFSMTQDIAPTSEEAYHVAHCLNVLNRAKFKIGDSVKVTRKGRREIESRFENRKYLWRGRGKVVEVKVHTFVRGKRKYPKEPFYIVEFGRRGEKFELDIWERFLARRRGLKLPKRAFCPGAHFSIISLQLLITCLGVFFRL